MDSESKTFSRGYRAGIQEGRSRERDIWMPKYDHILHLYQKQLIKAVNYQDDIDRLENHIALRTVPKKT